MRAWPSSREGGAADDDIFVFSSALEPRLAEMLRNTSGTAGFGYEVTLMRRYLALMQENAGGPSCMHRKTPRLTASPRSRGTSTPSSAVRYRTLASEELV